MSDEKTNEKTSSVDRVRLDKLNQDELALEEITALRKYATLLGLKGASKIPGGRAVLAAEIVKVRAGGEPVKTATKTATKTKIAAKTAKKTAKTKAKAAAKPTKKVAAPKKAAGVKKVTAKPVKAKAKKAKTSSEPALPADPESRGHIRGKQPKIRDLRGEAKSMQGVWTCHNKSCGHQGPPDDFGYRTQGGKLYRQIYCRSCRKYPKKKAAPAANSRSKRKKKAAVAPAAVSTPPVVESSATEAPPAAG